MRRVLLAVLLVSVAAACFGAGVSAAEGGALIKPWALNLPFGANITTEVNLTENDLLPTIKGLIPMIGDLAKMGAAQGLASAVPGVGEMGAEMAAGIDQLDTTQLSAAVEGVKAIRFLSGTYTLHKSPKDFQKEFEKGLAKTGTFSKVLGNIQDTGMGFYAQSNNGGYVGYFYEPKKGTVMATRLVGFLDIQKIMGWVMEIAKKAAAAAPKPAEPAEMEDSEHPEEPADGPAVPEAPDTPAEPAPTTL